MKLVYEHIEKLAGLQPDSCPLGAGGQGQGSGYRARSILLPTVVRRATRWALLLFVWGGVWVENNNK